MRTKLLLIPAVLGVLLLTARPAVAQEREQPSDPSATRAYGGYGAPEMRVTTLASSPAIFGGIQGGWIYNERFTLGASGYALANRVHAPSVMQPATGISLLSMGYGGVRFGGIVAPRRVVHFTFGALLGGGAAAAEATETTPRRNDTFWVLEPDIALEANLGKHVRLVTGVSTRLVLGTNVHGLTAGALSGPAATLAVKLGEF